MTQRGDYNYRPVEAFTRGQLNSLHMAALVTSGVSRMLLGEGIPALSAQVNAHLRYAKNGARTLIRSFYIDHSIQSSQAMSAAFDEMEPRLGTKTSVTCN